MSAPPAPRGSFGGITSGRGSRSPSLAGALETPNESAMRAARRRWTSGVAVVTTIDDAVGPPGFRGATVSAFSVASLAPPLVIVCLEREAGTAGAVAARGAFAVSVLNRDEAALADRFAGIGPLPDRRFTGIAFETMETGCPVIAGALVWFDCRVAGMHEAGDHLLFVGEVVAVGFGENPDDPLVNFDGAYRRLEGA